MPTEQHGMIVIMIARWLLNFIVERQIKGRVVAEVRYRRPEDQRNALIPNVSYRAGSHPLGKKGSLKDMPDMAVEVKSPDDTLKKMRAKARIYLAQGVRMVWLVEPDKRFVEVYTPDDEQVYVEGDMLSGGDVLPGFTLPVSAIFEDTAS